MENHIDLLSEIVVIGIDICNSGNIAVCNESGLCLLSLALLASLLRKLLLLHLLIAQSSQAASNLLDLITWEILGQLLCEILEEDGVVSLLVVAGDDWNEGITHLLELKLGVGGEKWKGGEIDGCGWVVGVDNNSVGCGGGLAAVADTNVAEQVLCVLEI